MAATCELTALVYAVHQCDCNRNGQIRERGRQVNHDAMKRFCTVRKVPVERVSVKTQVSRLYNARTLEC